MVMTRLQEVPKWQCLSQLQYLTSNSSRVLIMSQNHSPTFSTGPNTNSFGTKSSDGHPPQSSSPLQPNTQKNSILPVKKDSCDLQLCHSHGNCITEGKVTRCQCMDGYKGEFCQETETGRSHVAVILGVLCLIAVLMGAAVIFTKR